MIVQEKNGQVDVDIEAIREYFVGDQFATKCLGARIESYEPNKGVVSMKLDDRHHNAQGFVMGGVIMSLCDFALAVASNSSEEPCCSINHNCEMLRRAKGEYLIGTACSTKEGRNLCFYDINVHDELGTHVAHMNATIMRTPYVDPNGN